LARLQIMRVEKDWTSMLLAQADRSRHAEKMIAVDEIDSGRESAGTGKHHSPRDLNPHRGIIAVQPLLGRTKKTAVQNFPQWHAREKAGVGFKVVCRADIDLGSARSIDAAGRIGNRQTNNFRAEAAIGPRLRDKNLVAAARMPCRMDDRHDSSCERQGSRRTASASQVIPVHSRSQRLSGPHFICHATFTDIFTRQSYGLIQPPSSSYRKSKALLSLALSFVLNPPRRQYRRILPPPVADPA
jgi:hypothetical protein